MNQMCKQEECDLVKQDKNRPCLNRSTVTIRPRFSLDYAEMIQQEQLNTDV